MSQTAYSIDIPKVAFPGQPADLLLSPQVVSEIAEVDLYYGRLAVHGSASTASLRAFLAKHPTLVGDPVPTKILGMVMADQAREQVVDSNDPHYVAKSCVSLMRKGAMWVKALDAVTAGGDAWVSYGSGSEGKVGSSSLSNAVAVAGLRWRTSAQAGDYAILDVDLA